MAASAAWHKTKAALQQQELEEWRLLRGESQLLGCDAANLSSSGASSLDGAGSGSTAALSSMATSNGSAGPAWAGSGTLAAAVGSNGGATGQPAQRALSPLDEEHAWGTAGPGEEAGGQIGCCNAQPDGPPCRHQLLDCGTAEALIAAFADAEVREYLQQQVAALDPPHSSRRSGAGNAATAAAGNAPLPPAAGLPSLAAAAAATPSPCCPARRGTDSLPPAAAAPGDSSKAVAGTYQALDPVLAAWMVTRSPPDLPVRGYAAPPSRSACRLVAAQEMRR